MELSIEKFATDTHSEVPLVYYQRLVYDSIIEFKYLQRYWYEKNDKTCNTKKI